MTVVAIMIVGAISPVYAQSTNRAISQIVPLDAVDINDCVPELVSITGNAHIVSQVVLDESGNAHIVSRVNFQNVGGFGLTTGQEYRVQASAGGVHNFHVSSAEAFTETATLRFTSVGPSQVAPDFLRHITFHFTINANGEPTAEVVDVRTQCR
jgi:hypothetical protein